MKDFAVECQGRIASGDVKLYLPIKHAEKQPNSVASTRELNMLSWSFGSIYAGEVPAHLFELSKPRLRDVLSPPSEATDFHLSPRACAGVLKRDENRGRPLPEKLKTALSLVASGEDCAL
jgi:hypothetical protein